MRKRWAFALGAVVVLALIFGAVLLYFFSTPPPPTHHVIFPMVVRSSDAPIPTGNFPINQSAATQYATHLIDDYNAKADSEMGRYPILPSTQHFFPLYHSAGNSWEVLVARENVSATDDWIEFMFVKQIPAANPQIVIFTNESAKYLRPIVGSYTQLSNLTFGDFATSFGIGVRHFTTESPIGVKNIPLTWITNSSSVYNDIAVNSEFAAQFIYAIDIQNMNEYLNPSFPSWGWLWNSASTVYGRVIEVAGAIAIFITIYEFATGHRKLPLKNPRIRHPRKS